MKLFDANAATNAAAGILDANTHHATACVDYTSPSTFRSPARHLGADRQRRRPRRPSTATSSASSTRAIKEMTTAATSLGAAKTRIGIQQDFVKSLMDAIDRGIGSWSMPT